MHVVTLHPAQLELAVDVLQRRRPAAAAELKSRARARNVVQLDCAAPFVVWLALRDELLAQMPTVTHRKAERMRDRMMRLLKKVVLTTNGIERHPAMSGLALRGSHIDRFYVWNHPDWVGTGKLWTPVPIAGQGFEVLKPIWSMTNGWEITTWHTDRGLAPREDPFDVEAVHWRLLGEHGTVLAGDPDVDG